MYPLTTWNYEELCRRIDRLRENDLHAELVVVTAQLIEQVIKRHLAREINLQRQYWDPRRSDWTPIHTSSQRDAVLRHWQEPATWKPAWHKLLHERHGHPPIDQAFDLAVGSNAWAILIGAGNKIFLPGQADNDQPPRHGLRYCRHQLVHGIHSPPINDMTLLGKWGAEAVKRLLDPETGWPKLLNWNAQERLPALRIRKR